ncbi:MAG: methionyl-tRNA formyltransferase [Anaerolineae bacterium]|nr:methionyl-tRNA formyltransferase [Anaerolineae bacterium]
MVVPPSSDRGRTQYPSGARIVFLGSPQFGVPSLRELAQHFHVVEVITQPDRPAGRGRRFQEPPVKRAARELGLPVWQPEHLRGRKALEHLRSLQPDCGVVAAYGEILPREVLDVPARGFLNVHASLLPRYRGASPVSAAILNGDGETGVSIMLLDEGMDTGPVLARDSTPIQPDDTRGSLEERLAELGADLLRDVLPGWLAGSLHPEPQDERQATITRPLTREDGEMQWTRPADYLERLCRAMDPWPGAYTHWEGTLLKVWRAEVPKTDALAEPGTVVRVNGAVAVGTGRGLLRLLTVQPEGRPRMPAEEFVRGRPQFIGARLGTRDT